MRVARVVVNHRPRVYPMHHSVLPEEGGGESRGRSSSSKQAVAREDRVAKRNPELARVRTGGLCPSFVDAVGFGRAPLPISPALAGRRFRLAGQGVALTLCNGFRLCMLFPVWRAAKRNGAFAERFRLSLRVAGFSVITALAGYPYFGNHSAGGKRVGVAHHPCVQPMHHSVLPEMSGGVSRRWPSSSKQVVARESRMAKRNPRLARVRTGGIAPLPSPLPLREQPLTADPLIRTNSDQTSNPSSCYFCGVKLQVTDFTLFFCFLFSAWVLLEPL